MQETYKKTPFMAQLEAKAPKPDSFVHTRTCVSPKATHHSLQRDPCNNPAEIRPHAHADNLFPCLQDRAAQVRRRTRPRTRPHARSSARPAA
jgi:hypothetical protein